MTIDSFLVIVELSEYFDDFEQNLSYDLSSPIGVKILAEKIQIVWRFRTQRMMKPDLQLQLVRDGEGRNIVD